MLFVGLEVVYCFDFVEWPVFGFLEPVQLVSLASKSLMAFLDSRRPFAGHRLQSLRYCQMKRNRYLRHHGQGSREEKQIEQSGASLRWMDHELS